MTKIPKVPTYEEKERCLEIRKRAKRGDNSYLYNREQTKFISYMLRTYPEWYKCTENKIFNDTVPFGSQTKLKEGDCNNAEYLIRVGQT